MGVVGKEREGERRGERERREREMEEEGDFVFSIHILALKTDYQRNVCQKIKSKCTVHLNSLPTNIPSVLPSIVENFVK